MNGEEIPGNLHVHFQGLDDKWRRAGKRHKLIDVITIAIYSIPSHDTFGRIFSWLDPKAFEDRFLS